MRIKDIRVSHVDLNFVFGVLFILAFCFENELLQDGVVTCDDATDVRTVSIREAGSNYREEEATTHLIFSSGVDSDPESFLRFVLVIYRISQRIEEGADEE